jgi:hypothetical protein
VSSLAERGSKPTQPQSGSPPDRRETRSVDFVRDWITQLRLRGGDFDKLAAQRACEAAFAARRAGSTAHEVFALARLAYYRELSRKSNNRVEQEAM